MFNRLKNFFIINNFCTFNKLNFKKKVAKSKAEVLIEFNAFQPDHIFYSFLSNILSAKYNAKINAYYAYTLLLTPLKFLFLSKVRWFLGSKLNLFTWKIYKSFNVEKIFYPVIKKNIEEISQKKFNKIYKKIKKKKDIENIKIEKILFGDLIYDTFLRKYSVPTIDFEEKEFKIFLLDFIKLIYYWLNYFKENNVKAVVGSHYCYTYGITLRISTFKNIESYTVDTDAVTKLNKKYKNQWIQHHDFRSIFKSFNSKEKKTALKIGKNRLIRKFKGATGYKIGVPQMQKSAFSKLSIKSKTKKLFDNTSNIKVLICSHDFFDAAHSYGNNFFPDFYEWIIFLGKMSNKTNYEWYIKTHPPLKGKFERYQKFSVDVVDEILKKYPKIKKIPPETSHLKIIKDGIDVVLTVFGTVATEYSFFNIPVINASLNNPHAEYNFSITPNSYHDYKKILLNLKNLKFKVNIKDLFEYYYMRVYYFSSINWMFSQKKLYKNVFLWSDQYSSKIYQFYMSNFNRKKFMKKYEQISNFVHSKDTVIRDNNR